MGELIDTPPGAEKLKGSRPFPGKYLGTHWSSQKSQELKRKSCSVYSFIAKSGLFETLGHKKDQERN